MEITKASSKGQVVIPQKIREDMKIKEGTAFIVVSDRDTICFKKIQELKMKGWAEITKPLKEAMAKTGLKESDVPDIVHRFREKQRAKNENYR